MSYTYRGRTTHDYAEYQRWRLADEAEGLRESNSALRAEARRLEHSAAAVASLERTVRSMARQSARLEERQHQQGVILERVQQRQEEYERRSEQRRQQMENELRAEIHETREKVESQIEELAWITTREIAGVRKEVATVKHELERELLDVRQQLDQTKNELEHQIVAVHDELQAERNQRVARETSLEAQARALADWVEGRIRSIEDLDSLGLTIEGTRTDQTLERTREQLAGQYKDLALPIADSALISYQTAYLESERRKGVIDGVADHVEDVAARLAQVAADEQLSLVFAEDSRRLLAAAERLRDRAASWRSRRHWHTFESQRTDTVNQANELAALAIELQGAAPGLVQRLRQRDEKLKDIAATVREVAGPVDRFETGYANPADPKSPRLLRAFIGRARIDTYLDLDGGYNVDAYGFDSGGDCGDAAARMGRKLSETWQVSEARIDPTNPQAPSQTPAAAMDSWQVVSSELSHLAARLDDAR